MDSPDLLNVARTYLPEDKLSLVAKAYAFAERVHEGQTRRSGEQFVEHPLHSALTLAELQLDAPTLAAALLHDVAEDCGVSLDEIEREFGVEVRRLVDGVTKLSRIEWQALGDGATRSRRSDDAEVQAENLRKMLVAMAEDLRVVFIKLADRLHNMQTLSAQPPAKRRSIAEETLEIYAPLAARLGIWDVKWQLEDLAFHHVMPQKYREISQLVASRRAEREGYIARVVAVLKAELTNAGIAAEVSGRPKHFYSIYMKREKYADQGKDFGDIYDLEAVRVLVDDVRNCYGALGVVHSLWHPIPGQFDDHIANPKTNLYQSLHTSVICLDGRPLEIQIRTHEMHRIAEFGIAAHWRYKEGSARDMRFDEKVAWLRQLLEWQKEVAEAQVFVESVKTDIFRDQVFVFTPKGDIKDLPAGATPLDFAYRIHTDLGNRCVGARVNGRLIALNSTLRNGDVVEILTTKADRGPSRDWLNSNLGYIHTTHAREKIRQWFRRQERAENVERGHEIVERELKRLGVSLAMEEVARLFRFERLDDFFLAAGIGEVSTTQLDSKLVAQEEPELPVTRATATSGGMAISVMGVGSLLTQLARCCHPVPGDAIIGFITRSRGVSVHRQDCVNVINEDEKERLVPVTWMQGTSVYPVPIRVEALDRVGLLRDISTIVSGESVNMSAVNVASNGDSTTTIAVTIEISNLEQLGRILSKLEGVRGVTSVARATEAVREASR